MSKVLQAAGQVLRIKTWTPSRYAKWKECPAKVKYEDLLKMCPLCFRGRVSGGYDGEPVTCDTCDGKQPERPALDRGNRLDAALTAELARHISPAAAPQSDLQEATRHPVVAATAEKLRKAKGVTVQESIVLDAQWQRVGQYTKDAWARLKLDVLHIAGRIGKIIDWKSGNIDKRTGQIRERDEYHDSMRAYQIVVLAVYPKLLKAEAKMVFLDAPPKLADPTKSLPVLTRAELPEAQAKLEAKLAPMLNDTILAPRPGMHCNWCSYSKAKGGPCPH